MSWETHEAAERIADGWYSELEETRKRNAVLGRENARLRELVRDMWPSYCYANSGCETFLTDEQDAAIRDRVRWLRVINK